MTLPERAAAYNAAYATRFPASELRVVQEKGRPVLYGHWVLGNDYRNRTRLHGAYPPGYLPRVMSMFPDMGDGDVLHAFSGSLPPGHYTRLDLNPEREPDVVGSVLDAAELFRARRPFRLIVADPPYTPADAEKYGTPMVDRRRATAALAQVLAPGGFLVWLDTKWPMHRKAELRTCGRIAVEPEEWEPAGDLVPQPDAYETAAKVQLWRSTNHDVRGVTIFERQAA